MPRFTYSPIAFLARGHLYVGAQSMLGNSPCFEVAITVQRRNPWVMGLTQLREAATVGAFSQKWIQDGMAVTVYRCDGLRVAAEASMPMSKEATAHWKAHGADVFPEGYEP